MIRNPLPGWHVSTYDDNEDKVYLTITLPSTVQRFTSDEARALAKALLEAANAGLEFRPFVAEQDTNCGEHGCLIYTGEQAFTDEHGITMCPDCVETMTGMAAREWL